MLRGLPALVLSALLAAIPRSVQAQDGSVTITLSVSPSFVDFNGFGGRVSVAVVRLSASTNFNQLTGAEVSAFAQAPLGGATSITDCPTSGRCVTRATPSLLSGALASFFVYAGDSGLRASLGGGTVNAHGGEGLSRRSTLAGLAGLDWTPRTDNRFAPTFSIRLLQLSAPLAGARQLLLPGVGIRF